MAASMHAPLFRVNCRSSSSSAVASVAHRVSRDTLAVSSEIAAPSTSSPSTRPDKSGRPDHDGPHRRGSAPARPESPRRPSHASNALLAAQQRQQQPKARVPRELESGVWVPRTRSPHDLHVFVDDAAEPVSSQRPHGRAGTWWSAAPGWALIE